MAAVQGKVESVKNIMGANVQAVSGRRGQGAACRAALPSSAGAQRRPRHPDDHSTPPPKKRRFGCALPLPQWLAGAGARRQPGHAERPQRCAARPGGQLPGGGRQASAPHVVRCSGEKQFQPAPPTKLHGGRWGAARCNAVLSHTRPHLRCRRSWQTAKGRCCIALAAILALIVIVVAACFASPGKCSGMAPRSTAVSAPAAPVAAGDSSGADGVGLASGVVPAAVDTSRAAELPPPADAPAPVPDAALTAPDAAAAAPADTPAAPDAMAPVLVPTDSAAAPATDAVPAGVAPDATAAPAVPADAAAFPTDTATAAAPDAAAAVPAADAALPAADTAAPGGGAVAPDMGSATAPVATAAGPDATITTAVPDATPAVADAAPAVDAAAAPAADATAPAASDAASAAAPGAADAAATLPATPAAAPAEAAAAPAADSAAVQPTAGVPAGP